MSECGYPEDWFVESIDEKLKCGICCNVLRNPISTKCGHIYCARCLMSWTDYYGVCPEHCREVEVGSLKRQVQIEKVISGLLTHCKNKSAGCMLQVVLSQKQKHERNCQYRSVGRKLLSKFSFSQHDIIVPAKEKKYNIYHKRSRSSGSSQSTAQIGAFAKRSPSSAAYFCKTGEPLALSNPPLMPVAMNNSKSSYSTHTFRLKRTRIREPLGLVLVSGEKTSEGRPKCFYVKKVNPDTLGWRAGLQPRDRITQVDLYDLDSINPQEAVARIKEKTLVTLTVLRGLEWRQGGGPEEHLYDEILYTDSLSQNLSQQDENSLSVVMAAGYPKQKKRSPSILEDNLNQKSRHSNSTSGGGTHLVPVQRKDYHVSNLSTHHHHHSPAGKSSSFRIERGSRDSGLSSGSSNHHDDEAQNRHGFVMNPEPNHCRQGSYESQSYKCVGKLSSSHCRREGNYEVEEIYLQKNGTSQLGITLGYDTKLQSGQLYVCEVLPNGLAAQNGRLKCGDTIRRVNGFEVHDPEEAILLFLEQDQDITLTVAREIKVHRAPPLRTTQSSTHLHPDSTLDYQNSRFSPLSVRRVDSCGSLDARTQFTSEEGKNHPQIIQNTHHDGYEKMRRTKSASSTSSKNVRRRDALKSKSPPARQPSPLAVEAQQPTYQVLEQGGSSPQPPRQQSGSPQPPRQQSGSPQPPRQPTYQVLEQPPRQWRGSPQPPQQQSGSQQPTYQVLEQPPQQCHANPQPPQQQNRNPQPPQQPTYQVLEQPHQQQRGSPQPPQQPAYQEEQQSIYHVLEHSVSPLSVSPLPISPPSPITPPPVNEPTYQVLDQPDLKASYSHFHQQQQQEAEVIEEELRPLSVAADSRMRARASGMSSHHNTRSGSTQSLTKRPSSTTPLTRHRIDVALPTTTSTSSPSSAFRSPRARFHSVANELDRRCETVPADYMNRAESLV